MIRICIDSTWFIEQNWDPCQAVLKTEDGHVNKPLWEFAEFQDCTSKLEESQAEVYQSVRQQFLVNKDNAESTPVKKLRDPNEVGPPSD